MRTVMLDPKTIAIVLPLLGRAPALADTPSVLDCGKQKTVSIATSSASVNVVGTCDKVTISGNGNTISIASTKNMSVIGSKNVVGVRKVDKIAAIGSENQIAYSAGLSRDVPKIADAGKRNAITQTK